MNTPLKTIRKERGLSLVELAAAVDLDAGNMSRIERGIQGVSPKLAEKIVKVFGEGISEMEILYPERYTTDEAA